MSDAQQQLVIMGLHVGGTALPVTASLIGWRSQSSPASSAPLFLQFRLDNGMYKFADFAAQYGDLSNQCR